MPHHLLDLVDPDEEFTVTQFQRGRTARRSAGIAGAGTTRCSSAAPGCTCAPWSTTSTIPGRYPEVAAALEAELDEGRAEPADLHARLAELDPVGAARMEPTNRRRVVRALEVTLGPGRPFSAFGPGLEAYPATGVAQVGPRPAARGDRPAHRGSASRAMVEAGLLDEVRALAARPGRHLAHRAPGARLPRGPGPRRGRRPLDDCLEEAVRRTRQFARRQASWFRRDPRIAWAASPAEAQDLLERALAVHG